MNRISWLCLWVVLAVLTLGACSPVNDRPDVAPTNTVNVVTIANLRQTVEIEIGGFDATAATPYPAIATITDPAVVAEFVDVLDTELVTGPAAACLDAYRLRFRLSDGTLQEFGFLCEPEPALLRSELPELAGQSIQAPKELAALVQEQVQ
jgi:hypothetical protein